MYSVSSFDTFKCKIWDFANPNALECIKKLRKINLGWREKKLKINKNYKIESALSVIWNKLHISSETRAEVWIIHRILNIFVFWAQQQNFTNTNKAPSGIKGRRVRIKEGNGITLNGELRIMRVHINSIWLWGLKVSPGGDVNFFLHFADRSWLMNWFNEHKNRVLHSTERKKWKEKGSPRILHQYIQTYCAHGRWWGNMKQIFSLFHLLGTPKSMENFDNKLKNSAY